MAALNFPASPSVDDTYTFGDRTWRWDGTVWVAVNGSNLFHDAGVPSDSVGNEGDFYLDTSAGKLYGPKGASSWAVEELSLIPKRFSFSQPVAATTWNITHDLDGFPSVSVVDSAGSIVVGDVEYNSTSSITVSFESAFAGTAYLT
jgi:hypothetical protein